MTPAEKLAARVKQATGMGWSDAAKLASLAHAPTYEDAKRKAETWIQARINGMPASGRWA